MRFKLVDKYEKNDIVFPFSHSYCFLYGVPRMCNNRVNEEKQMEIIQLIAHRTGCNDYDRKYTVERGACAFIPLYLLIKKHLIA